MLIDIFSSRRACHYPKPTNNNMGLQRFGKLNCDNAECSFFDFAGGFNAFGFVPYLLSCPDAKKHTHVQTSKKQSEQVL